MCVQSHVGQGALSPLLMMRMPRSVRSGQHYEGKRTRASHDAAALAFGSTSDAAHMCARRRLPLGIRVPWRPLEQGRSGHDDAPSQRRSATMALRHDGAPRRRSTTTARRHDSCDTRAYAIAKAFPWLGEQGH